MLFNTIPNDTLGFGRIDVSGGNGQQRDHHQLHLGTWNKDDDGDDRGMSGESEQDEGIDQRSVSG
ncbi:hypothetical protein BGZ65_012851, partial [Modicella reniformis]